MFEVKDKLTVYGPSWSVIIPSTTRFPEFSELTVMSNGSTHEMIDMSRVKTISFFNMFITKIMNIFLEAIP